MFNVNTWMGVRHHGHPNISHSVISSPGGALVCWCGNKADAEWVAARLNLAANLEERTAERIASDESFD